ncbi:MAG: hypothetical protein R3298_03510 [Gammaproteobacteria bacterium]|nr:hypothetical protein [Gammaproteobacteria bacterium]
MSKETEGTVEAPVATTAGGAVPTPDRAMPHAVVGGIAAMAIALIVSLWYVGGGRFASGPATSGIAAEQTAMPGAAASPRVEASPATARQAAPRTAPASGEAASPAAPAVAFRPMPGFVAPHGVINPLTMLHDPAYYRQWAQVGGTFGNPLAYQRIMLLMMQHTMQAWGTLPPNGAVVRRGAAPHG